MRSTAHSRSARERTTTAASSVGGGRGLSRRALLGACDGKHLVVACAGEGVLARAAARTGATVTAVEASAERARLGRELCERERLDVRWAVAPVTRLPVAVGGRRAYARGGAWRRDRVDGVGGRDGRAPADGGWPRHVLAALGSL